MTANSFIHHRFNPASSDTNWQTKWQTANILTSYLGWRFFRFSSETFRPSLHTVTWPDPNGTHCWTDVNLCLSRQQYTHLCPVHLISSQLQILASGPTKLKQCFVFNHVIKLNPSQCSITENIIQNLTHWVLSLHTQWSQMFSVRWTVCCLYFTVQFPKKKLSPWDYLFKPWL